MAPFSKNDSYGVASSCLKKYKGRTIYSCDGRQQTSVGGPHQQATAYTVPPPTHLPTHLPTPNVVITQRERVRRPFAPGRQLPGGASGVAHQSGGAGARRRHGVEIGRYRTGSLMEYSYLSVSEAKGCSRGSSKGDVNSNSRTSHGDYRHGRSNGSPKVITDVRQLPDIPRPARLDILLSMPPVPREEQREHSWNPDDRSYNIYVM
ncbi:unnamed protein product, partial [Notodromas monacha]